MASQLKNTEGGRPIIEAYEEVAAIFDSLIGKERTLSQNLKHRRVYHLSYTPNNIRIRTCRRTREDSKGIWRRLYFCRQTSNIISTDFICNSSKLLAWPPVRWHPPNSTLVSSHLSRLCTILHRSKSSSIPWQRPFLTLVPPSFPYDSPL